MMSRGLFKRMGWRLHVIGFNFGERKYLLDEDRINA